VYAAENQFGKSADAKIMSAPILPIENMHVTTLPPTLDGTEGSNRARGVVRQTAADTDVEAIRLWLSEYANSPHTLRNYCKEAVRLLFWATQVQNKALSSLNR
jgi:hypothetical protein